MPGINRIFWNVLTRPFAETWCGGLPARFSPRKRTSPRSGLKIPVMRLKTVVFPAPLGPIKPTRSPLLNRKEKSDTAFKPPKHFVSPSMRSNSELSDWIIVYAVENNKHGNPGWFPCPFTPHTPFYISPMALRIAGRSLANSSDSICWT